MKSRLVVSLCHFCEVHGPVVLLSTQIMHYDAFIKLEEDITLASENNNTKQISCEGCLDFSKFDPGFISMDTSHSKKKPTTYVTSLKLEGKEMNKTVEQICARSISCEQYPGQQGAIMYADDGGFATFSYKFFLKDFHSRGFKRSYVVNVICDDKFLLFNSWLYLVDRLEVVVARMRADAENHFNHEHALHSSVIRSRSPTKLPSKTSGTCPLKGVRRERGYQGKQTRSIAEMTDNSLVFEHLHVAFVGLLKGLTDHIVSASEMRKTGGVSEELVDLEKQEETEEGFIKVFKYSSTEDEEEGKANTNNKHSNVEINNCCERLETTKIDEQVTNYNTSDNNSNINKNINSIKSKESSLSGGVEDDAYNMQVFSHPRVLMKVLGGQNFTDLLHHLLVGHQVIVRAKELPIISSIIECLKTFLPKPSDHLITPFTRDYSTEQRNKLLIGMPLIPLLPTQLSPCLILDVSGVHMLKKTLDIDMCWIYKKHKGEIEELVLRYYMLTIERLPFTSEDESVLEAIHTVLLNNSLENSLADLCLQSLKQEWISKAKIYKACMRNTSQKNDEDRILQVIGAKQKDRQLLQHWAKHYCL